MSLRITPSKTPGDVGRTLFLSASIPDASRWQGRFDPLAITDAVVAVARTFLSAGWRLVTAAHPTIAPLLLYVADELDVAGPPRITTYQSRLFEDVLPAATRRFEAQGVGRFVWTPAASGDHPRPAAWDRSLAIMRTRMLTETDPDAAVFVGGMEGITDEWTLFGAMQPGRPRYPLGAPGGAARGLPREHFDTNLRDVLAGDVVFPAVARAILEDLG